MSNFRRRLLGLITPEEYYAYGVEWDTSQTSPDLKRIGNMALHRTLPVQSQIKGCLLDDKGNVVKYLNESDWTSETRDGSQGQVMIELPKHYEKFETSGTIRRVFLSTYPLVGYTEIPKAYVGAYLATVQRSTSKLCSVVNTSTDYRGGNNASGNDSNVYRSFLGRPATNINSTDFRTYARNRGNGVHWNKMCYHIYKEILWMYVVEYASFNIQKPYKSDLTDEGYHQGGLGYGAAYNDSGFNPNDWYPFIPCGYSDSLGNGSGIVNYKASDSVTVGVPRYRGMENLYSQSWQWTDGIIFKMGRGVNDIYVTSDPSQYKDNSVEGYTKIGSGYYGSTNEGWIKNILFGDSGDPVPIEFGESDSTYYSDYAWIYPSSSATYRVFAFGAGSCNGSQGGVFSFLSSYVASYAYADCGSRLCFIP